MTDEISESTKLGALVVFTSGFLTVSICVFVIMNLILNNFSADLGERLTTTSRTAVFNLAGKEFVSGPECYTAISQSLDLVQTVKVAQKGTNFEDAQPVYHHNGKVVEMDNLMCLFTRFSSTKFKVHALETTTGSKDTPYIVITLVEVD